MQPPSVTRATDIGRRYAFGIGRKTVSDSSTPATTSTARGSNAGGSFIQTSARRLCQIFAHTSAEAIVVSRNPVSLFFRLVPYRMLKTPVYHHVLAANSATPAANVA